MVIYNKNTFVICSFLCYKVSTTVQVITANKTKTTHRFCYLLLLQHLNRLSKWSDFQKYRQFPKSRDIHPVDGFLFTRQDCVYFPHVIFRDFIWNIDQMSRTHECFCDSFCAKSKKMLTWRMEKGNSVKETLQKCQNSDDSDSVWAETPSKRNSYWLRNSNSSLLGELWWCWQVEHWILYNQGCLISSFSSWYSNVRFQCKVLGTKFGTGTKSGSVTATVWANYIHILCFSLTLIFASILCSASVQSDLLLVHRGSLFFVFFSAAEKTIWFLWRCQLGSHCTLCTHKHTGFPFAHISPITLITHKPCRSQSACLLTLI